MEIKCGLQMLSLLTLFISTQERVPIRKILSTFIVDTKDLEWIFSVSKEIHKMGMRSSPTGELDF
jgi:alkylation response protein AidB-like acyl-CoA dehydrogenase